MKVVIQRALNACVTVNDVVKGSIDKGLLVYLGVACDDTEKEADWLADKIINLRIFEDSEGIMNLSLKDIIENCKVADAKKTGILVISQFTLMADARKGRRPSWNLAAKPEKAVKLYNYFVSKIKNSGLLCEAGEFQAHMKVNYTNDGPVTIILDTDTL